MRRHRVNAALTDRNHTPLKNTLYFQGWNQLNLSIHSQLSRRLINDKGRLIRYVEFQIVKQRYQA